ncbi:DUF2079 domain-containing protein [Candidatus Sumerlaeota bacterium]|nr:DUF2079 domain-containing protein [Candidatus Sumerlaeota bacterium]
MEHTKHRLPDWLAIALGHLALAMIALMLWNWRVEDVFPNTQFYFTAHEKKYFLKYGVGLFAFLALILHGLAWRLSRLGANETYSGALAGLCRAVWPGWFCALGLLGLISKEPLPLDAYNLIFITGLGLALGSLTAEYLRRKWTLLPPAALPAPDVHARRWLWGVIAACMIYAAYFSWLSIRRHEAIHTNLQDFSLYDQLLWNLLHGNGWRCTLWDDNMRFGWNWNAEHFMPTLLLLLPFYAVAPAPHTLLIAQSIALGAGAIPLYFIAKEKLRAPAPAFFIALAFLSHPIVQQTNIKEFHMDALAPVFLLAAYAFYLRRKWLWYAASLLLALGCKEDVAISVAMFGLFLVIGERNWRAGLATFAAGMLYSAIVIQGVIPHYRDGEPLRQLYRYRHLLPDAQRADAEYMMTLGDLVKAGLLRPHVVWHEAATPERLLSALKLGAPFGFFALIGGWVLLWAAPSTATSLLSNWNTQYELQLHYGIAIIPPLAAATVWGVARWAGALRTTGEADAAQALKTRAHLRGAGVALFICLAITQYYFGYLPGGERDPREKLPLTEHTALAQRYAAALPADASVSAQVQVGAQVAGRETIYMFPVVHDAQYILLDTRRSPWPMNGEEYQARVKKLLESKEWGVIEPYEDGYLLLKRNHSREDNAAALARLEFKKAE